MLDCYSYVHWFSRTNDIRYLHCLSCDSARETVSAPIDLQWTTTFALQAVSFLVCLLAREVKTWESPRGKICSPTGNFAKSPARKGNESRVIPSVHLFPGSLTFQALDKFACEDQSHQVIILDLHVLLRNTTTVQRYLGTGSDLWVESTSKRYKMLLRAISTLRFLLFCRSTSLWDFP